MPFRKLENCNQVVKIGKQLKFSLVNLAGNDIVQGNKKLIVGELINKILRDVYQPLLNLSLETLSDTSTSSGLCPIALFV